MNMQIVKTLIRLQVDICSCCKFTVCQSCIVELLVLGIMAIWARLFKTNDIVS